MLKTLAILAVLLLGCVYPAWPQIPRDGRKQDRPTQKEADKSQPVKPSPSAFDGQPSTAKQEESPNEKSSDYPWKELLAPANIPNWVLCFVGGVAGVAAVLTLRAIKRQADMMERQTSILEGSLAAAQKSADAFINKERARVFIRGEITDDLKATLYAENRGGSPARFASGFFDCEVFGLNEEFPKVPDYSRDEAEFMFPCGTWLPPKTESEIARYDALAISDFKGQELLDEVLNRKKRLWFYGIVRYQDTVSNALHETKFCMASILSNHGDSGMYERGPEEYRSQT